MVQVRATRSSDASGLDAVGASITSAFDFGRLNSFIDATEGIAPRVAATCRRSDLALSGSRWGTGRPVDWMRLRVDVAGGGLVDVRVMAVSWVSLSDTLALLEDLYYENLTGEPTAWDSQALDDPGSDPDRVEPMHQVVLLPDGHDEPDWALWQRLIYRFDDDARREFTSITQPAELNRRHGQVAAVGTYGTVLWRIQNDVEQGIIASAALNVSAVSSLQRTRALAHTTLKDLHRKAIESDNSYLTPSLRRELRRELVETQETLSFLDAGLTFGAEASATIAPLLPSLRIESYHQALYQAAGIQEQAAGVDRMLGRLRSAVGDELATLQNAETIVNELRVRRWSIGAQALAGITIPLSLLLAFFSTATNDVDRNSSLFDLSHYWPIYTAVALLVATVGALILTLQQRDRRRIPRSSRASRHYQKPKQPQTRPACPGEEVRHYVAHGGLSAKQLENIINALAAKFPPLSQGCWARTKAGPPPASIRSSTSPSRAAASHRPTSHASTIHKPGRESSDQMDGPRSVLLNLVGVVDVRWSECLAIDADVVDLSDEVPFATGVSLVNVPADTHGVQAGNVCKEPERT